MPSRTSDANGRSGKGRRRGTHQNGGPSPDKPRTLDHFCKPCSLIAKGDERDCEACHAAYVLGLLDESCMTWGEAQKTLAEAIAKVTAIARGKRNVRGAGARNMANIDIHGRRWGWEPSKPVHISGWEPKG